MQTFLPLPDYYESMICLDKSRLGNQVWLEGMILLRGGWKNHPASRIWRGHEYHLGLYLLEGCRALAERGKAYPAIVSKIELEMSKHPNTGKPSWLGNERFHASHRAALLAKNFQWYSQFGWSEQPDPFINNKYNYYWPK